MNTNEIEQMYEKAMQGMQNLFNSESFQNEMAIFLNSPLLEEEDN